ncbi:hypothetical protein IWW57_001087 [Coemansia sp. S610]|uniref:Proteasome maturation factor UMP1 n=1 Tax=Coemansia spiralis TaxID=417178 RepID=A0A9W8L6B2_9FUNG|nr:hypothetical protein IWW57_001087 [Coemansia sp. S610]KAJ2388886.1 hypothetical protein H4S02_002645 [Coemansia sp. RSA 2611]KAJ2414009.1 hypothetical protein GGI10_002673 [Coemansia sp. RSA 2530]KAJ2689750.1 hypothetical protein IWW39_001216 [Coemansia spiralis]KAJ2697915.1 hypothetical protein H4218_003609 [Coemansia sp. IMI 209128]
MATSYKFENTHSANVASVLPQGSNLGVQSVIGQGPRSRVDDELTKAHPLESRLANWNSSQLGMKLHMQRKIYGLHAPLRTMMEVQAIKQTPYALNSRASRVQLDILLGRDDDFGVEDIYDDDIEVDMPDVHAMLSKRMNA